MQYIMVSGWQRSKSASRLAWHLVGCVCGWEGLVALYLLSCWLEEWSVHYLLYRKISILQYFNTPETFMAPRGILVIMVSPWLFLGCHHWVDICGLSDMLQHFYKELKLKCGHILIWTYDEVRHSHEPQPHWSRQLTATSENMQIDRKQAN